MGTKRIETYNSNVAYGRSFHAKTGVASSVHGSTIIIPSPDNMVVWEKCLHVATMFVGFKTRARIYKTESHNRAAVNIARKLLTLLYMRFNQKNDDSAIVMVAENLGRAFNLQRSKVVFNLFDIVDCAFALTMGDPEYAHG